MHDEHLADVLSRRSPEPLRDRIDSDERNLPEGGGTYLAYARSANNPVFSLHCILGKDGIRSFQNSHLDSNSQLSIEGKEQVISLRFCSWRITAITIRGRNLGRLYDYIHQHRMPWIARVEAGRDFAADDEPVITAIEIAEDAAIGTPN